MIAIRQIGLLTLSLVSTLPSPSCLCGAEIADDRPVSSFQLDLHGQAAITAVDFDHKSPPPWPDGNCISYGKWNLVNIHAENLGAFRKKSGVRFLSVLPIDGSRVLVVDERVGREWLRTSPCKHCASLRQRLAWLARYREHFGTTPEAEALIGSVCERIHRQGMDTDGDRKQPDADIIEAILPGDRLHFRETTLVCRSSDSTAAVERAWIVDRKGGGVFLSVHDVDEATDEYEAVVFQVNKLEAELRLMPTSQIKVDGRSKETRSLGVGKNGPYVSYRLVSRSEP